MQEKISSREHRIVRLATEISKLMRLHGDGDKARNEAIDAYDVARIMFRSPNNDDSSGGRL